MYSQKNGQRDGHPTGAAQDPRSTTERRSGSYFLGLFDNTQVIFLDGTNGKLGATISNAGENSDTTTHNLRGIHPSSYYLQPHFRVLLDDLETLM